MQRQRLNPQQSEIDRDTLLRVPIWVNLEIDPRESAAIEMGARRTVGRRNYEILWKSEENGWDRSSVELELQFGEPGRRVRDKELEEARAKALDLYAKIRDAADLEPAPASVVGIQSGGLSESPEWVFTSDAEELFEEKRFEMAVVAAQTACEVVARTHILQMYDTDADRFPVKPSEIARWSLREAPARLLFILVAGKDPVANEWWPSYVGHITRRNNVVHRGARVTETDARESLDLMWQFIEFVREALPVTFRSTDT